MLQMEFKVISYMKIFLVALFHTKHFRPQPARVGTFFTFLYSILRLVFFYMANSWLDMFCHGDRPIFTAAQFFTFSLL
jgi:hypothetical protein